MAAKTTGAGAAPHPHSARLQSIPQADGDDSKYMSNRRFSQGIFHDHSGAAPQTAWGYLPNSGDRRLASINNAGLAAGQFSNYAFTTTPEKFISAITETSDSALVYPGTLTQSASYDNLNQLINLSSGTLTYGRRPSPDVPAQFTGPFAGPPRPATVAHHRPRWAGGD